MPTRGRVPGDNGNEPKNLIIIHGCPPGDVVRADSTLTQALLNKLRRITNMADNSLVLNDIQFGERWVPRRGEILGINPQKLLLQNVFQQNSLFTSYLGDELDANIIAVASPGLLTRLNTDEATNSYE